MRLSVTMPVWWFGNANVLKHERRITQPKRASQPWPPSPMTHITEETFEQTLQSFIRSEQIDLRDISFIDPYGMLGLLEIGELCMLEDVKKTVLLPQSCDVCAYLERMDFFTHARRYFSLDQSSCQTADQKS